MKRSAIWSSLKSCGVPDRIIDLIQELYSNAFCHVRFKNKCSDKFTVANGVRQGCVLSPSLYIIVLDMVLKGINIEAPGGIQWRPYQKLSDLDYEDVT